MSCYSGSCLACYVVQRVEAAGYGEGAHIKVIICSAQLFPRSAMAAPSQETVVAGPPSNLAPCRGKVRPAPPARGGRVPWRKARLTRTVINMIMSGRSANPERADPPLPASTLPRKGDGGHDDTRNVRCVTEALAKPSTLLKKLFLFLKRQKQLHTK